MKMNANTSSNMNQQYDDINESMQEAQANPQLTLTTESNYNTNINMHDETKFKTKLTTHVKTNATTKYQMNA